MSEMAARRDPVARILDGLLHALARYGVQRVSMTDVANEAGISRGTLYRYFSTKEDVLAALGTHVLDEFRNALKHAVDPDLPPEKLIQAVVGTMASFVENRPSLERLTAAEPAFAIAFFRSNGPEILSALEDAITPAFAGDANRRRRNRNATVVSEMILRIFLSYQLVPGKADSSSAESMAAVLAASVDAPGLDQAPGVGSPETGRE